MNAYGIMGALLIMAGLGSWGAWEDGQAAKAKADLVTLKASYFLAAQQAKDDAAKQEASDVAALKVQSSQAISQAQTQANQAQQQLVGYQKKLAAAATVKDLGHRCAGVEIPKELIP